MTTYAEPAIEDMMKTGKMTKKPIDMTGEEQTIFQQKIKDHAREYLFSIGQPLVNMTNDGGIIIEYPDGRIEKK